MFIVTNYCDVTFGYTLRVYNFLAKLNFLCYICIIFILHACNLYILRNERANYFYRYV